MMQSERESRFRDLVATVEPPASRITVAGLIEDGRRTRQRRRRWSAAAVAGVVTLGVAVSAGVIGRPASAPHQTGASTAAATATATACTVERLALPAGATAGEVSSASPDGRFLAGTVTGKDNPGRPVRWDGTHAAPIAIDGTGEARGVNDSGVVVGRGQTADRKHYAWAYAGGKLVKLPIPKGYTGAEAEAVNAAGQIAGVLYAGEHNAAVVWQSATATAAAEVLDAPGGAMAFGISDTGVVVGSLEDGSAAYRWDADGHGSKLAGTGGGALGARGDWAYGLLTKTEEPTAIHPTGGITVIDPNVAVVWNLTTGKAETVADGRVEAVGTAGQVAVNHDDRTASIREADGTLRPLPPLTTGGKAYVYALSADGTLAGGGSAARPVRWSCAGKASR